MCGIIGYKGSKNAADIILSGLSRLEYRGYDSWGVAIKNLEGLKVFKQVGKISDATAHEEKIAKGCVGMGHTRWATHGKVTEENTHPHTTTDMKIAVVHNGIIENYQELRDILKQKGHTFTSQTDTEAIAHLIEEYTKTTDFLTAVKSALADIKGSFAIVCAHKDCPDLVCARRDSPLVIGVDHKNKEYFVASDIPAFIEHTKDVIFVDDNELVILKDQPVFYNLLDGRVVEKKEHRVDWSIEQAKKGDFEHYMIKEIKEQKETIKNALAQKDSVLEGLAKKINEGFGVFFVAAGTSLNAAKSAAYMFSKHAGKHVNVADASEFEYYKNFLTPKTLMITLSQSGETADVLSAVKAAKEKGVEIISIVNVMGSSLARTSDVSLLMNAGPEICVAATKTYTSQLAILHLLAYAITGRLNRGREWLKYAADKVDELTSDTEIKKLENLAMRLKDTKHMYLIGRGLSYPTAEEAALKIKEVSYIHAEAFSGGALKHGAMALIEERTPVIAFAPNDETFNDMISNCMEVKARGAFVIGISPKDNEAFDFHIKVPELNGTSPIANIIPIQVLSYYLAVLNGLNPDKPRNLAKSVTVK